MPTYRVLGTSPELSSFGVGRVIAATDGVFTLENGNEETMTVDARNTKPIPTELDAITSEAVEAITLNLQVLWAMARVPYVRTFADLHDHMDANVLLINHVPEVFERDADGDMDERQSDLFNTVCNAVDKWMKDRWDNDPYNQPAPSTDEQVASILAAMLEMSTEEIQWGRADKVEVLDGFGDDQVRLRVDDHTFTIRVTREG